MTSKDFERQVQARIDRLLAEGHAAAILEAIVDAQLPVEVRSPEHGHGHGHDTQARIGAAGIRVQPVSGPGTKTRNGPFNLRAGSTGVTYKVFGESLTDTIVYCAGRSFPIGIVTHVYLEGDLREDEWDCA